MALEDRKLWGETHRDLPGTSYSEGAAVPLRSSKRGELGVQAFGKSRVALADEGSYFVATNPTPGTAIAGIAATGAFSDAESLLFLRNANTPGTNKRIYLDYLRLSVTVAGTNGTDVRFVSKLDKGTSRYTSGGSAITPVNVNIDSTDTSGATLYFGALVTAAASSDARLVGNGLIRNVITVVGDEYVFDFGGATAAPPAHAIAGTAIARVTIPHAPVVIGPEQMFVLSLHAASQTVASQYEFELGFWER